MQGAHEQRGEERRRVEVDRQRVAGRTIGEPPAHAGDERTNGALTGRERTAGRR